MSSRGGRSNPGPWNRLKPVNQDPLEAIGLPSKGDDQLLDHKIQERYYAKIVERYMAFCSDAGQGVELSRRLARLELAEENGKQDASRARSARSSNPATTTQTDRDAGSPRELSVITMAMRKLREGIVASHRVDNFSVQAYMFCIRLSILLKHMESYHPALLHLLRKMHPVQALATTELQEFVGYLVLDSACRQNDLAQAYLIRNEYSIRDTTIDTILRALAHDNFYLFWRVKRSVDGHRAKLMEFTEDGMKRQALKCLGRSYLTIDLPAVERYTSTPWPVLIRDYGVGWHLEGSKVVVRKPKTR